MTRERFTLETYRDDEAWCATLLDANGLDTWDAGGFLSREDASAAARHVAEKVGAVVELVEPCVLQQVPSSVAHPPPRDIDIDPPKSESRFTRPGWHSRKQARHLDAVDAALADGWPGADDAETRNPHLCT